MTHPNLLVELFVEELPPKALPNLGAAFANAIADGLRSQGLIAADAAVTSFASPRRLGVHVAGVAAKAEDRAVVQKLMPASVGLDPAGQPTAALVKKLAALGLDAQAAARIRREGEGKSETLYVDTVAPGATLADALQKALHEAIARLPIPKVMTYQLADGWTPARFVRPAHGLVALHGADVVPLEALGLRSGRETRGHRFEAQADPIVLADADSYAAQLRDQGAVIAAFDARRAEIARQLAAAAAHAGDGLRPIDDPALLDEVTALVERPNVLLCAFDPAFLDVPQECLILTMKANQKYFPLLDTQGRLTNRFLVVSNIAPADPSAVVEGNERVVRPRLADAKFFYDQDRRKRLEERVSGLDKVVYHARLGSQGERTQRVRAIARSVAEQIGGSDLAGLADRAALLAKADLLTDMVGEFPELQGVMGRYYALHDGEDRLVAEAIEDHYRPRFSGDALPRNEVGLCVALADKLETLAGLFAAGERPTGDKDPFALRRHALGVIRMLDEKGLRLRLSDLLVAAIATLPLPLQGDWTDAGEYILDRAQGYYVEQGFDPRAVDAVVGPLGGTTPLATLHSIMVEATDFIARPEGQVLAAANKRITNILKKAEVQTPLFFSPHLLPNKPDPALFQADAERTLYAALLEFGEESLALQKDGQFSRALAVLVPLHEPVTRFFDEVMVNVDEQAVRDNRITLLQHARAYMNLVADLSRMAG